MNVKICTKTSARTVNVYNNTPQATNNFCEEVSISPALNGINQKEIHDKNDTYEILENSLRKPRANMYRVNLENVSISIKILNGLLVES